MSKKGQSEKVDQNLMVTKEKWVTLEVVIRMWDKENGKLSKFIHEIVDGGKFAKIFRTHEGHMKVVISTGYCANPKIGLYIPSEGLSVPPEGLIINL